MVKHGDYSIVMLVYQKFPNLPSFVPGGFGTVGTPVTGPGFLVCKMRCGAYGPRCRALRAGETVLVDGGGWLDGFEMGLSGYRVYSQL